MYYEDSRQFLSILQFPFQIRGLENPSSTSHKLCSFDILHPHCIIRHSETFPCVVALSREGNICKTGVTILVSPVVAKWGGPLR
jgi:hypothetical protein